jgi:hypothetical protein
MKKLIAAFGVLFVYVSQCMEASHSCRDEHIKYLTQRKAATVDERRSEKFSTSSLDVALRYELANDTFALEAYHLFHSYEFDKFLYCWIINHKNMHPDNVEKIREILIFITPIVAESKNINENEIEFAWDTKYDEFRKAIFESVCSLENATPDQIKFPRFCYEMLGKAMVDIDDHHNLSDRLSIFLEDICRYIYQKFEWDERAVEQYLFNVVGLRENDWGNCSVSDVWPKL